MPKTTIAKRFLTVVVLYAVVALLLAISDGLAPRLGWFAIWLDSWTLKLGIFVALWLIAPWVAVRLEKSNAI